MTVLGGTGSGWSRGGRCVEVIACVMFSAMRWADGSV